MPLQHLDEEAQQAIKLAERIAHEAGLEYVGTDHILLAILRLPSSSGARLLHRLGVDELKAAAKVDELVERSGEDTWVFGRLPGSPHYRNVIANAIDEATRLKAPKIGTVHIVLGLLREQDSTAQQVLSLLGVTLRRARDAAAAPTG